jgi:predicted glycosyltransferase
MINRSRMIIARSGYSTIMELAALGKRAFFIPTPGQTEQEYLAEHTKKMGWWYTITQDQLNIARDLQLAWQSKPPKEFTGDFNNLTQMLAIIRKDLD